MIPLSSIYLLGTLVSILPTAIIYYLRPELRQGIIKMGLIFLPFTLATEYFFWTQDWWTPQTVTGTRIGIEDVIITLSNIGFIYAIYPTVFRKQKIFNTTPDIPFIVLILFLNFLGMAILFWGFHITSVIGTILLSSITSIILIIRKPSLLIPSLFSGAAITLVCIPIYWILMLLSPEFIAKTWIFKNLTGILFIGIPIEDILFYLLVGIFICAVSFYKSVKTAFHQ